MISAGLEDIQSTQGLTCDIPVRYLYFIHTGTGNLYRRFDMTVHRIGTDTDFIGFRYQYFEFTGFLWDLHCLVPVPDVRFQVP